MSQSRERMQALEKEYQAMPHDKARMAAIYAAIREANAAEAIDRRFDRRNGSSYFVKDLSLACMCSSVKWIGNYLKTKKSCY